MTTTLITGANKGLGYEAARQLIAVGHTVYLGCRDPRRGQDAAQRLGARLVELDVTDDDSVADAAQLVDEMGGIDVLINNAGVEGRGENNSIIGAEAVTAAIDARSLRHERVRTRSSHPRLSAAVAAIVVPRCGQCE